MKYDLFEQIEKLTVAERIELLGKIWDSVARDNDDLELTQAQKDELDRRVREFEADPSIGRSWDEIKTEYLKKP